MKHNVVIGSLVFGLGMVTGWFIKPAPTSLASSAAARGSASKALTSAALTSPSEPAIPGKRAQREPVVQKPANMPTEEQTIMATEMKLKVGKTMINSHLGKLKQQIVRLDEKLQLTKEQKSGITTWLDDKISKIESIELSDSSSFSKVAELANSTTNEALENQLASTLNSDQKAALTDLKDSDLHLKIDAMALKSLSKLQGAIDFEDGQRDEVYKILTKNAEVKALAESKNPDINKILADGMGFEIDPYDLGLEQVITDTRKEAGVNLDQPQTSQKIREAIDKRIEEKVNQLQPVLNDKQLARYREELKSKGMGIFGAAVMGTDDAQSKK
jgi:hypothetical protein